MIRITHNFNEQDFKWLWAKYVKAGNLEKHCAACLKGPYSKKFSGTSNRDLIHQPVMEMDEVPQTEYKAIYFCGVIKKRYPRANYPHNVHFAVLPVEGRKAMWEFEQWRVEIENGVLLDIPAEEQLDERFFAAPYDEAYRSCRIFRWMVGFFYPELTRRFVFEREGVVHHFVPFSFGIATVNDDTLEEMFYAARCLLEKTYPNHSVEASDRYVFTVVDNTTDEYANYALGLVDGSEGAVQNVTDGSVILIGIPVPNFLSCAN